MLCPKCSTAVSLDHTTEHTTEEGTKITHFFYTCTNQRCGNYLKILNGSEFGEQAQIKAQG